MQKVNVSICLTFDILIIKYLLGKPAKSGKQEENTEFDVVTNLPDFFGGNSGGNPFPGGNPFSGGKSPVMDWVKVVTDFFSGKKF